MVASNSGRRSEQPGVAGLALELAGADRDAGRDLDGIIVALADLGQFHRRLILTQAPRHGIVDPLDQRRDRRALIAREVLAAPEPDLVERLAAHHDCGAVLARDGDDLGGGIGGFIRPPSVGTLR
jgi:hypothetical protein